MMSFGSALRVRVPSTARAVKTAAQRIIRIAGIMINGLFPYTATIASEIVMYGVLRMRSDGPSYSLLIHAGDKKSTSCRLRATDRYPTHRRRCMWQQWCLVNDKPIWLLLAWRQPKLHDLVCWSTSIALYQMAISDLSLSMSSDMV